jgi:hypothetical protein
MDARGLLPTAKFVLRSVIPYLNHQFKGHEEATLIVKRIEELIARLGAVDESH